jgi:SAM-dependent methyltransferase
MESGGWAWDLFWHFDRVASCCDEAGRANYDPRIADGWRGFFHSLENDTRILDLCTGNGAVALIALEVSESEGKQFAVAGVDRAAIDPAQFAVSRRDRLEEIDFQGQVEAELLPFADASFGAVTSQYGIEYSDLERSLPEAVRVLGPGGRLRFCLHAAEGTVAATTKAALADADFMLDEIDLPGRAEAVFEAVLGVERSDAPAASADRAFAVFRDGLAAVGQRIAQAADPTMLQNARSVLAHAFENRGHFPLDVLLGKAAEVRTEIEAHRIRQRALLDAAVSAETLGGIAAQLESLGLEGVETSEVRSGEAFLGYVVEGAAARAGRC